MSQHDLDIANQLFPAFRTALNNALSALGSTMIGASAPPAPMPGMLWIDNSAAVWRKKLYDGTDWITVAEIDPASNEHCPYVKSFKFEPTAMASALIPDGDSGRDLGSATHRWQTLHAAAVDGVTSVNAGPLAGFRNAIINGGFDIWQRGTSQTSDGYGSDDRWTNMHSGSTKTHTRESFPVGQTLVPGNPRFLSRTAVTAGAGAGDHVAKAHRIEGVRTFAGETVTLSFWARADAPRSLSVEFAQRFGSGGTPTPDALQLGVTKFAITPAWQRFSTTVTLPGLAGKTLGSHGDDDLQIVFWFDAGSSFDARTGALGHQSGIFDIAQVQLEPGRVATPFERRPTGAELALCQRYYTQTTGHARFRAPTAGALFEVPIFWPVTMRVAPTAAITGQGLRVNAHSASLHMPDIHGCRMLLSPTAAGDCYAVQQPIHADSEL